MYSTSTYLCISFGIWRYVRGAEEEDEERAHVFCAFCLSPFCCFLSALEQRLYRYETANSFLMFLIFGLETNECFSSVESVRKDQANRRTIDETKVDTTCRRCSQWSHHG